MLFKLPQYKDYYSIYDIKSFKQFILIRDILIQMGGIPSGYITNITLQNFNKDVIKSLHLTSSKHMIHSSYTTSLERTDTSAFNFLKHRLKPLTIRS